MFKKFTDYKLVSLLCICALAFILGSFIWFAIVAHGVTSQLILHFNDVVGVTQVGNFSIILEIGFLAILIVFLNTAIALELAGRDRFLGVFTAGVNLTIAILLFIATSVIIGVN